MIDKTVEIRAMEKMIAYHKSLNDVDLFFRSRRLMDDLMDEVNFGDNFKLNGANLTSWFRNEKVVQALDHLIAVGTSRTGFKSDMLVLSTLAQMVDYCDPVITGDRVFDIADITLDEMAMGRVHNMATLVDCMYHLVREDLW